MSGSRGNGATVSGQPIRWMWCTVLILVVTGCAHITPLSPRPRPGATPTVPVPPDANDVEYFGATPLMVPVLGVAPDHVPDTFNESRDDGGRLHRATDILVARGTPVLAAAAGKILRMSQNARGGITLYELDDHGRFVFYYAHLDHYSDRVSEGEHILQGEVLGYVGSSGNADPRYPHLHFQAMRRDQSQRDYWNGAPVDVRPFFTLTGKERDE